MSRETAHPCPYECKMEVINSASGGFVPFFGMNRFNIPNQIAQGEDLAWRDSNLKGTDPTTGRLIDFSPNTHSLSYSIRGATALDLTAVADGSDFLTTIDETQSQSLTPGINFFQCYATSNGKRQIVGAGQITVVANLATVTTAYDGRSQTQKMLDAVNAAILAIAEGGAVQSYSIKGRSLSKMPISELLTLRDRLKVQLVREKAAESVAMGFGDPRRLYVRFGRS